MTEPDRDLGAFERRSKALFEAGVDGLDAGTRSRLAAARQRALERGLRAPISAWLGPRALWPAAVTAAGVLALALLWRLPSPETTAVELAALQDLEILLGEEELDMLEELEFYTWLEEQADFEPPPGDDSVG